MVRRLFTTSASAGNFVEILVKKRPPDDLVINLRVVRPPDPECPKCHNQEIENLYPVVPRWLSCPKCGHMWSNRTAYDRTKDRERSRTPR